MARDCAGWTWRLEIGGQPIDYDGKAGHITNGPDANRYLDREYRKGWEL